MARLQFELIKMNGNGWMRIIAGLISFIKLATDGGCLSQKHWRAEVLIELTAAVDKAVFEAVCADPIGMFVLISPKKARSLTAVTRAVLGLGLTESDGKRVFSIDAKRYQAQGQQRGHKWPNLCMVGWQLCMQRTRLLTDRSSCPTQSPHDL